MGDKPSNFLDEQILHLKDVPVIQGYYLVIGGGKIGNNFVNYARDKNFPFVLITDINKNASAAKKAVELQNKQELVDILKKPIDNQTKNNIYFYQTGLEGVPFILSYGIPEYIIPAVPYHAVAELVSYFANTQRQNIIEKLSDDVEHIDYFKRLVLKFPENIVAGKYPEYGMIMLSYAKEGEICPDDCMGPADYCPNFNRIKLKTITQYVNDLTRVEKGWIFESYQMKQGIGGLKGKDLKAILLDIMEYLKNYYEHKEKKNFFIATTCNCHGVINLFSLS
jgi:hypothetical protein